jgi:hypothetical protein
MYIFSFVVFIFTIHSYLKLNKNQNIISQSPDVIKDEYTNQISPTVALKEPNETKSQLETVLPLELKKYLLLQSITRQNILKYHEFTINRFLKLNSPELINQ